MYLVSCITVTRSRQRAVVSAACCTTVSSPVGAARSSMDVSDPHEARRNQLRDENLARLLAMQDEPLQQELTSPQACRKLLKEVLDKILRGENVGHDRRQALSDSRLARALATLYRSPKLLDTPLHIVDIAMWLSACTSSCHMLNASSTMEEEADVSRRTCITGAARMYRARQARPTNSMTLLAGSPVGPMAFDQLFADARDPSSAGFAPRVPFGGGWLMGGVA